MKPPSTPSNQPEPEPEPQLNAEARKLLAIQNAILRMRSHLVEEGLDLRTAHNEAVSIVVRRISKASSPSNPKPPTK